MADRLLSLALVAEPVAGPKQATQLASAAPEGRTPPAERCSGRPRWSIAGDASQKREGSDPEARRLVGHESAGFLRGRDRHTAETTLSRTPDKTIATARPGLARSATARILDSRHGTAAVFAASMTTCISGLERERSG